MGCFSMGSELDEAVDVFPAATFLGGGSAVGAKSEQLLPVVLMVHRAVRLGLTKILRQRGKK